MNVSKAILHDNGGERTDLATSVSQHLSFAAPLNGDKHTWYWFAAIAFLATMVRLACFTGLIASDDLAYSHFAEDIASHRFVLIPLHFALRFGLNIPVAWNYRLLGVSEWTTILVPLLASISSIVLLMAIGKKLFGSTAAFVAGILAATFPVAVRYSTILVPEPVAELYVLLGVLTFLYAQEKRPFLLGFLAGVCLGIAYLTKEPSAFIVPALLIEAAITRHWSRFGGVALGALLIVAVEHSYYLRTTGDLLFRPHALTVHNISSMVLGANADLSYRLLKSYPRMMLVPNVDLGLHSLITAIIVLHALFRLNAREIRFLVLWPLLPFLYLNFGTTSFRHYIALPVAPRYIGWLYGPIFLIVGAMFARYASHSNRAKASSFLLLAVILVVGFGCAYSTRAQGYYTDDVKALRLITKNAMYAHISATEFQGDRHDRWRGTVGILEAGRRPASDATNVLVIKPDVFGLPSAELCTRDLHDAKIDCSARPSDRARVR